MSERHNGPRLTIKADCFGCVHERSERYACQGDSGSNVYCAHPTAVGAQHRLASNGLRTIGDTTWDTPEWCPLLPEARNELAIDLTRANAGVAGVR